MPPSHRISLRLSAAAPQVLRLTAAAPFHDGRGALGTPAALELGMSTHAHPLPAWDLRAQMNRDHQRLDLLFDQVLTAFRDGDRGQTAALWAQFDTGLRNHFDFEELHLIPQFRKQYPKAAAALLAEHTQLLSLLKQMNLGVDRHLTRSDIVDDFIVRLRAHAEREDALLYRWAQVNLGNVEAYALPTPRTAKARR